MWTRQLLIFLFCAAVMLVRQSLVTHVPAGENLLYYLLGDMSMGRGTVPLPIGISSALIGCYLVSGVITGLLDKATRALAVHTVVIAAVLGCGLMIDRHFASKRWGSAGSDQMAISYVEGFDYARTVKSEVGTDSYVKLKKAGINRSFAVDNCYQLDNADACKSWEVGFFTGSGKRTMNDIIQ